MGVAREASRRPEGNLLNPFQNDGTAGAFTTALTTAAAAARPTLASKCHFIAGNRAFPIGREISTGGGHFCREADLVPVDLPVLNLRLPARSRGHFARQRAALGFQLERGRHRPLFAVGCLEFPLAGPFAVDTGRQKGAQRQAQKQSCQSKHRCGVLL